LWTFWYQTEAAIKICFVDILVLKQKQLSKLQTPSYFNQCTTMRLDLRKSAPFATVMHMLPVDKGEALAVEMDMVWHSGSHVTIETQVDMRDSHGQEKMVAQSEEPGLAGVAALAPSYRIQEGSYDSPSSRDFSSTYDRGSSQKYSIVNPYT
jgi:hypothetical protein